MPRSESDVALAAPADAQALETVNRHLDAGNAEYVTLRPLLAQAEVAAQRVSSGVDKARLGEHVAERDALRDLVDATPVGLAALAAELRWTDGRRRDDSLEHDMRGVLDERAAALRARRARAQDDDPYGMFLPVCDADDDHLDHLEPVCVPVSLDDTDHLVVSVVNVREFTEVGRFTVPAGELGATGQRPNRRDVLAAARQALPHLA